MRDSSRRMLQDLADITGNSQEDVLDKVLRLAYKQINWQRQADTWRCLTSRPPDRRGIADQSDMPTINHSPECPPAGEANR